MLQIHLFICAGTLRAFRLGVGPPVRKALKRYPALQEQKIGEKKLLLAGVRQEIANAIELNLAGFCQVIHIDEEDTLGTELISSSNLALLDFSTGDYLPKRIAQIISQSRDSVSCQFYHIGDHCPSEEVAALLPEIFPLPSPIDFGYLKGLVDSAAIHHGQIQKLASDQVRIRLVNELSSNLLKVNSRSQISEALSRTLPKILKSPIVLLAFPALKNPIVFYASQISITEKMTGTLRDQLAKGWEILRPDAPVDWKWISDLQTVEGSPDDLDFDPSSILTIPISRGSQTEGFLTFQKGFDEIDEGTHQTYFLIGDLIAVLMFNLHLREELERRATRDGLTGLLNRQTTFDQLEKECQRAVRYENHFSVVMFDLDHFKSINDTYLHQGGDQALRDVADLVRQSIREVDIAGRFGGEEFIVILPYTNIDGAKCWAERLRRNISEMQVKSDEGTFSLTVSAGVACTSGEEEINPDRLVALADAALYKAKQSGRNKVFFSLGGEKFEEVIATEVE